MVRESFRYNKITRDRQISSHTRNRKNRAVKTRREFNRKQYLKYRDKILERHKKYREKNKELLDQKFKEFYYKNRLQQLERVKLDYKKNKKKRDLVNHQYRKNNPEKVREWKRKEYLKHKDKIKLRVKIWRNTPIGKVSHKDSNSKRRSGSKLKIDKRWLINIFTCTINCPLCNVVMDEDGRKRHGKTIDHFKPLNIKGEHTEKNIWIICRRCNISRLKDGSDMNKLLKIFITFQNKLEI